MLTLSKLRLWAKTVKDNILALYLSARDERMPALPKWLALITVAYAISPIDLVPDFIPIVGYADDLIFGPRASLPPDAEMHPGLWEANWPHLSLSSFGFRS